MMTQVRDGAAAGRLFPEGDYVSPGFEVIRPDAHFPTMIIDDPRSCSWPYLRKTIRHNWYRDKRVAGVGFANRDEAHILYNTALRFRGQPALEIGCFFGWSTCHLALGGVQLDVIDPLLARPEIMASVRRSLPVSRAKAERSLSRISKNARRRESQRKSPARGRLSKRSLWTLPTKRRSSRGSLQLYRSLAASMCL